VGLEDFAMKHASEFLPAAVCAAVLLLTNSAEGFEPIPPGPDKVVAITKGSGSFLGISVLEIDADRAKALNLKEERGVEITRVEDDSPALKSGLKVGDVVLDYNGQRVEGVAQFIRMVHETPAGREVKLAISRAGSLQTIAVKTGMRKVVISRVGDPNVIEIPRLELPDIRMPDVPRAYMSWRTTVAGIDAESLDSQLAEYFGVKEGVLVRAVSKGSAAEKSGLKAGDVIVKIDDSRISTPREIANSVRAARPKKTIPLQIIRERREVNLTLALEDAADQPAAMPRRSIRP
jgi:serine protease Do